MKKLIFAALAAISIGTASYAITAEEAIASKNYYVINDYCKEKGFDTYLFIAESNDVSIAEYIAIRNSCTNDSPTIAYRFKAQAYSAFSKAEADMVPFEYCTAMHKTIYYTTVKYTPDKKWLSRWIAEDDVTNRHYRKMLFDYDMAKIDISQADAYDELSEMAINFDAVFGNNALKDILSERVNSIDNSARLNLAIAYGDVDKIVDALLLVKDVTAAQASAMIAPINAVDAEYRKADILKALNNVNSRCTIKLYDDQKTWEPILAKIRAMISVRK